MLLKPGSPEVGGGEGSAVTNGCQLQAGGASDDDAGLSRAGSHGSC